ncbi:MAG: hypothetical protein EB119_09545 [Synechococcaceae bacterium WBB_34_004]|nr:hypothetical protein [Synechococcaceae bacterium WBB_34_004]
MRFFQLLRQQTVLAAAQAGLRQWPQPTEPQIQVAAGVDKAVPVPLMLAVQGVQELLFLLTHQPFLICHRLRLV